MSERPPTRGKEGSGSGIPRFVVGPAGLQQGVQGRGGVSVEDFLTSVHANDPAYVKNPAIIPGNVPHAGLMSRIKKVHVMIYADDVFIKYPHLGSCVEVYHRLRGFMNVIDADHSISELRAQTCFFALERFQTRLQEHAESPFATKAWVHRTMEEALDGHPAMLDQLRELYHSRILNGQGAVIGQMSYPGDMTPHIVNQRHPLLPRVVNHPGHYGAPAMPMGYANVGGPQYVNVGPGVYAPVYRGNPQSQPPRTRYGEEMLHGPVNSAIHHQAPVHYVPYPRQAFNPSNEAIGPVPRSPIRHGVNCAGLEILPVPTGHAGYWLKERRASTEAWVDRHPLADAGAIHLDPNAPLPSTSKDVYFSDPFAQVADERRKTAKKRAASGAVSPKSGAGAGAKKAKK